MTALTEVDRTILAAAHYSTTTVTVPAEALRRLLDAERALRARVAGLRTPPIGESADAWLQEIIDDRPEGAYEGRDVYDHRGALLALHELTALRVRVRELEAERETADIEWGVGDPDDCASDEDVAIVAGPSGLTDNDRTYGRKLLRRDVRRGPWRVAQ